MRAAGVLAHGVADRARVIITKSRVVNAVSAKGGTDDHIQVGHGELTELSPSVDDRRVAAQHEPGTLAYTRVAFLRMRWMARRPLAVRGRAIRGQRSSGWWGWRCGWRAAISEHRDVLDHNRVGPARLKDDCNVGEQIRVVVDWIAELNLVERAQPRFASQPAEGRDAVAAVQARLLEPPMFSRVF